MNKKTAVVYKIPCGQCDRVYIGQTSRTLEQRIKEHKRALKNFDVDASGLTEHEENHSVDWSKATVIEVQSKCLQRRLLELWHIGKERTKSVRIELTTRHFLCTSFPIFHVYK